jgi:hypothetical protein
MALVFVLAASVRRAWDGHPKALLLFLKNAALCLVGFCRQGKNMFEEGGRLS